MVNTPSCVQPTREPAEVMRGHALECSLFSAMAIGGLALGCPATAVYRHLNAARRSLTKCQGLREPPVVSALVLYGVANALLPPCGGGDGGDGDDNGDRGRQQQEEHKQEYQSSLDSAQALYVGLPVKDPLMTAFLTYRAMCDNLVGFLMSSGYSVNPANVHGRFEAALGFEPGCAGDGLGDGSSGGGGGEDLQRAVPRAHVPPTKAAHPSYVVADCECALGGGTGRFEGEVEKDRARRKRKRKAWRKGACVCVCTKYSCRAKKHLSRFVSVGDWKGLAAVGSLYRIFVYGVDLSVLGMYRDKPDAIRSFRLLKAGCMYVQYQGERCEGC